MARKRMGKGEGSIYRRGDGRWIGQYEVNGKSRYISGKVRAEVAKELTKAIAERDPGLVFDTEGLASTMSVVWIRCAIRSRSTLGSTTRELDLILIPHEHRNTA